VILACGFDEKTADGVLRVSFCDKTTEEEVLTAVEILNELGSELKSRMD
jgi:cysteine sulfinate desulfinase/cysteine desulfurase-like protein